jgi:hypothetical protein
MLAGGPERRVVVGGGKEWDAVEKWHVSFSRIVGAALAFTRGTFIQCAACE